MTGQWDVIVVGAGPGGSRAAELLAKRNLRVVMLDPKVPWEKPCGGGLTAAALQHVPQLRELDAVTHEVREVLVVAPSGASIRVPLRQPFRVVSRLDLGRWGLRRAEAAGVTFVSASVRELSRQPGAGWRVIDGDGAVYRAQWLVGADGATSRVRVLVAPGLRPELAPTRVDYPLDGVAPGRAVIRFLPNADGYLWDFPRPGHHSIGVGVAPGTFGRRELDGVIQQHELAEAGRPSVATRRRGAVIATSLWSSGSYADLGGADYALVGDAAGLADPATGEGIDYALRSGAILAESWQPRSGFTSYPRMLRGSLDREVRRARFARWALAPHSTERLVRLARWSARGALLLAALVDALNEHSSIRSALWRVIRADPVDRQLGRQVCDCALETGLGVPVTSE